MRVRTITSITVIGALALAGIALAPVSQASSHELVIGVEAPLTGAQASNGQDMLRGVKLAVAQANAKGGVLGHKVRIVELDDQADPGKAADMVAKAKRAGVVAVVGPYNSSVGIVNLPLYLKAGIVPVHMTSTNDTNGMGVTVQPKNNQISPIEDAYANSIGAMNVAMLVDPSTYTQGMADRLSAALKARGATVTSIPVVEGKNDYSAEVAQAFSGVPDLIYVSTYYPEGAKIAQRLALSKLPTRCLMGLANVDPAFVTEAGQIAAERCVFSGVPEAAQLPGAKAAAYVADYTKAFKKSPGVWGAFTYDSANLLFSKIAQTGTTKFAPVLKALTHTKNFKGATGTTTIRPSTGNRVKVPVYILKVDSKGVFTVAP
ncbi:MAG: branched-chain amino acid ABC transporter substrate-binding protein [Candidatus Nanopelagicales bacterium]